MLRTRFSFASSVVALTFSALPAHAQSAPASSPPANAAFNARINDIQVARQGETVSILVKLSQQPAAAAVSTTGDTLTLEIDGLTFNTLNLSPPAGSLVTRVEAASGKLKLSGAAFSSPTTVIYRNAVLIEAKLAEPALPAATSLMGATIAKPQPVAPRPPAQPIAPTPVASAPALPEPETLHQLQTHPASAAVAPSTARPPTTSIAGIDAARCTTAAAELAKDAWALAAMGDHALCLIDASKPDEAKSRLDQLAAITPQDWRVALGRASLAEKAGDTETARTAFVSASLAAPNDAIRAAIAERMSATPHDVKTDIDLPLPTTLKPSPKLVATHP